MWALGLMLCEMLTGTTVADFLNQDYAKVWPNYKKELAGWIKKAKAVDENLGRIAAGLLTPKPADRYGAENVAMQLRRAATQLRLISDEPPPFLPVVWRCRLTLRNPC
jgi:NADPH-dependent 2,4-dienoyl-CoA reductase/sulfur reductase-like enzyme